MAGPPRGPAVKRCVIQFGGIGGMRIGATTDARAIVIERRQADLRAIGIFIVATLLIMCHRFVYDNWLAEFDISTFFLPWYGIVGESIRAGEIPGWTNAFSSGAPVAGDPSSGWMYLPVMLFFSLMDVAVAFKAMVLFQVLFGGLTTYLFSRMIGLRPLAATMSTMAFAFGPFLYGQTQYATAACQVATWIPLGLIAIELALRTPRTLTMVAAWALAGVAVSQMAAAWPGQGMMNGLLFIGSWLAYRALVSPPAPARSWRRRVVVAGATGFAMLAIGFALGAAGLLPRLAINAQSSIPNGDYSAVIGGDYEAERHTLFTLVRETFLDRVHYRPLSLSIVVIMLAVVAVLMARRRYAVPYFAGVVAVSCLLTMRDNPVHWLFNLLPEFQKIHEHSPRRMIWVTSLAPSMLAGAAVQVLPSWKGRKWAVQFALVPLAIVVIVGVYLAFHGWWVNEWLILGALLTTAFVLFLVLPDTRIPVRFRHYTPRAALIALMLLAFVTPIARDVATSVIGPHGDGVRYLARTDSYQESIDTYLGRADPGGAGEFLQRQQAQSAPFRYAGYAGRGYFGELDSYSERRLEPGVSAVLTSGRPARLGLDGIQGYSPNHLKYYVEYFDAMNGASQDYHWLDAFSSPLVRSPLLDMLNVRYIVVDLTINPYRADVMSIAETRREVFRNEVAVVYENADAFTRAWVVHDVRPNNDGEGLAQLASGAADGRTVAFIDGALPEVSPPAAGAVESVTITGKENNRLSADVVASAPGLAVFSEVYEEGWKAWVDGEPIDILRTNHALRGVPIGPGEHTVEFRYEPESIRIGLLISGVSGAGVLGILALASGRWLREAVTVRILLPSGGVPARPRPVRGIPGGSFGAGDVARLHRDP
ncbi:MAG: hypothetical protein AVDCRST_MAG87-2930 [uncultured Thermomicrobiales bacterium]|uniref:YfhO family protein n=1 Tax=uncultured Thermomicrobiales bacterium TaxID=1645740 RepID=A0A6J4VEW9_9BACT|nr:MAG: hypothetical protein AVDCRST_MAG87-2930 [uncultured Thermomicrobiales bacterium]